MVCLGQHRWIFLPVAWVLAGPVMASGLVSLDDETLAVVTGQDGLVVDVTTDAGGITINQVNTTFDAATVNSATLRADSLALRGVDGAGNVGGAAHAQMRLDIGAAAAAGKPVINFEYDLDRSRLSIGRLSIPGDAPDTCGGTCSTLQERSFGTFALDASGKLRLRSEEGFFNNGSSNTYFMGELTDATLFYRQAWHAHSYMVLNDMSAKWELSNGTLGITPQGIRQATTDKSQNAGVSGAVGAGAVDPNSLLNVVLDFDILYKFPYLYPGADQTTDFVITGNERPMMHFGWRGSLRNAEILWKPGGGWTGSTLAPDGSTMYDIANGKSQGLNFSSRWDFVNYSDANTLGDAGKEFRWVLGEASGSGADKSRVNFELGDWARWNPAMYSHNFPLIALDVVNAGQGVGGLCWGGYYDGPSCASGQFVRLTPGEVAGYDSGVNRTTAKSLGLFVRDGSLMSYSRRVSFIERDASGSIAQQRDFRWGLIYTFANVDMSAYIYAGGNEDDPAGGSRNSGMTVDFSLMSQTFGAGNPATDAAARTQGFNWDNGSHLMIADTDIDGDGTTGETRDAMGIGLVSSSFLVLANDMRIWVKDAWPTNSSDKVNTSDPYKGGIDLMSPETRFNLRTTFGGGILPDSTGSYGSGPKVVKASLINLNFEGMLNARLSPSAPVTGAGSSYNPCTAAVTGYTCTNYLGYSWAMRFKDTNVANFSENTFGYVGWAGSTNQLSDYGSFLSLAEPNQPSVDVRFGNITGDLALTNGVIDVVATDQDGDGKPKLRISHNMLLGAAAAPRVTDATANRSLGGAAAGQEFRIDRILLGGNNLGRIVIPSAAIYSSLTLKPQL